jgi:hypothetical protein
MSLNHAVVEVLHHAPDDSLTDQADMVVGKVKDLIRNPEVRRQVYIEATETVDGLSMMEIHTVLDSLIEVLGDADGD